MRTYVSTCTLCLTYFASGIDLSVQPFGEIEANGTALLQSARQISKTLSSKSDAAVNGSHKLDGMEASEIMPKNLSLVGKTRPSYRGESTDKDTLRDNIVLAYFAVCLLTVIVIAILYWRKGLSVITKVLVYLFALATMKGSVKIIEDSFAFSFPLFLTGVHFGSAAIVALAILCYRHLVNGAPLRVPTLKTLVAVFVPLSLFFGLSIAMCNVALVSTSTSFVEVISATSPIVTVILTLVIGKPFHLILLLPCCIVFLGCALCSKADPTYTLAGFLLAFGSNVPRSLKVMMQHALMQGDEDRIVYSPLEVLAWTCIPSSFIMLAASLVREGLAPFLVFQSVDTTKTWKLVGAILLSCVNACILNTANLFVIKDLGAVGAQLVAQTKTLLVVLGGMSVLGEEIPGTEVGGFLLVMLGVVMYNDLEARQKTKDAADPSPCASGRG